jgi:hypothetical protein
MLSVPALVKFPRSLKILSWAVGSRVFEEEIVGRSSATIFDEETF